MTLEAIARAWLGTPYHHHARLRGIGVDCVQLLCAVYEEAGLVPHIETGHYPVDWHLHRSEERYMAALLDYADQVPDGAPGDVVLFQFGRTFSHGGILLDGRQVIHSYLGRGVILSTLDEEPLEGRPVQFWRVRA